MKISTTLTKHLKVFLSLKSVKSRWI